jgi:O-antigen/teichoic acid export membrane protein
MIRKIKESDFIRNIFLLFSGSIVSQMIPFLALPVLQKYFYKPSDFGLLAIFVSFSELFANVATGKLEYGIVLESKIRNRINLLFGALRIMLVVSCLASVLAIVFKSQLANYFHDYRLGHYIFIFPIYILVFSLVEIGSYWFNQKKEFSIISFSKIVQTSSSELVKLFLGMISLGPVGLIIGRVMGFVFAFLYYLRSFLKRDKSSLRLMNMSFSSHMVRSNKRFFYLIPSVFLGNLINVVYLQLFLIFYGEGIVGLIGVSMTYLSAGFGVVAISFSQVFYSKLADTKSKEQLLQMYIRFAKNLTFISLWPVLLVYIIPSVWLAAVLGKEWMQLMDIARIMVLWLAVWFVSSSLSFVYTKLGKQKEMMIFDSIHLLMVIFGFFVGKWFNHSMYGAIWGFTFAQIVFYIFVIYMAIHFIKRAEESKL